MQDKTLLRIGEVYLEENKFSKPHHVYTENMYPSDDYKMVLVHFVIKELKNGFSCRYGGINIEQAGKSNYLNFAYREGTAKRSGNVTFTTKVADLEKRIKNIKTVQMKALLMSSQKYSEEHEIFTKLNETFADTEEKITNDLQKTIKGFEKNERFGLSFSFELNDKIKYLSHFKTIKDMLIFAGTEKKSESNKIISEGKDKICSVCQKKSEKLHGFANPLSFYTVDKPGFASNFFNKAASWKNYPICSECAIKIEKGLVYVEEKLRRSFWGEPYYIIPRMIYDEKNESLTKALNLLSKYEYKTDDTKIKDIEDNFFRYLSKESNYFFLDLLFYKKNNAEFNIKLMLEEIYPSRLRKLFVDVPEKIEANEIFREVLTRKEGKVKVKKDLEFNFGILRKFFDDDFYDLLYRTFIGVKIDPDALYTKFMNAIKKARNDGLKNNTYYVDEIVYCAIMTMFYFQELGILDFNNNYKFEVNMENENKKEGKKGFNIEKLISFIEDNKSFLDDNKKIGIFSVGILVKLVMILQYRHLNNTPFENKLRGLNISAELIKKIYVEALEKIAQYLSSSAYQDLREFIAKYFVLNSRELSKMSNDEISFYFVAGMELTKSFKGLTEEIETDSETIENN